ncbi:MAG: WGR domain-containing protein [Archangium sp.]|nr:WGR domain-containing protein [Archangium sp.]
MGTARRFVVQEGTSNKFWEIAVDGKSFTVRFGRLGTDGQSASKAFPTPKAAAEAAGKLVAEKVKKGYREESAGKPPKAAKARAKKTGSASAEFAAEFGYLVDTPGAQALLDAIAPRVVSTKHDESGLVFVFDRPKTTLTASPPAPASKHKKWPESFRRLMARHQSVSFPERGWALHLGDSGSVDFEVEELPAVREVLRDYSDWWVVGDGQNPHGEPELRLLSHESAGLAGSTDLNPGALFLQRVAEVLELDVKLDPPPPAKSKSKSKSKATGGLALSDEVGQLPAGPGEVWLQNVDGAPDWLLSMRGGVLSLYDTSKPGVPRPLGQVKLALDSLDTSFGRVKAQRVKHDLFLGFEAGFVQLDVTSPAKPRLQRLVNSDEARCTHWFGGGAVTYQCYLKSKTSPPKGFPPGDGVFRQELAAKALKLCDATQYGHDSAQVGDRVLFVHQQGVDFFDVTKKAIAEKLKLNLYWPAVVALPGKTAAVLETGDRSGVAVTLVDCATKKAGARLFKKHDVKAWCLEGEQRLWLVLGWTKGDENAFSLGGIELSKKTAIDPVPLPGGAEWNDLVWLRVHDRVVTVGFEDGSVRTLRRG